MSFINEDPMILELFVAFVTSAISCEESSLFEAKKAQSLVEEIKRKYNNPLVPPKNKYHHETRPYLILKTFLHHKLLIASSQTQKTYTSTYDYLVRLLLKLTTHPYKQIRTKAISSLETSLKSSFMNIKKVIKDSN